MSKTVWTFTNKKELDKPEFINYFERKVFRTIRKNDLLPKDKIFTLKELPSGKEGTRGGAKDLNTIVLKKIIEKKFEVKWSTKPNLIAENLSQSAEDIFKNALKGDFKNKVPRNAPLAQLSDKEIELYAELTSIIGTKRKQDKKIQSLFDKFLKKNQDLEVNVVKAIGQLN
jgi:hypothetical protein